MYECARCGYELTGLATPGTPASCPECGSVQYVEFFTPGPKHGRWRMAWRLSWRAVAWCSVCAVLLLMGGFTRSELLGHLLWICAPGAFGAGWYGALHEAWLLAVERHPPGTRRRKFWRGASIAGLALNLTVGVGYMSAAIVLVVLQLDGRLS